ncbi:hypothetical protein DL96DRAFT_840195 [Flagelloscypha sp. PMI_526]|nr:hypothetical protein DL96DRAFT_840195 [Flagelloscypha sp. PMI_526]
MSRRVPSQADPTYGLVAPVKRSLPPLRSLITLHESDTTQPRATSSPHDRSQRPSVSRHSSDSSWEASPHQHAEYSVTGYREDTIAENSADTEYQKAYAQHHALQYSPSPSQVVEYISSPVSAERWEDPAQRQYMTSHDNHKRVAPVSAPFIPRNTVVHINSSPTSGIWVSNPQELAHQVAYNRYEYTTRGHDPLPQETDLASPPAAIHSPPYSPQVQFEHWTPQQVAAIAYPAEQHLQQAHLSRDAHMSHNGAYDSSSQSPPMHYHVASTAHLHPLRHARYSQHPSDYEAASNTSVAPMSHQIGNELTGQQLDDKDFAENSPAISPPQLHASAIVPPVHMDPARHLAYAKIEGHCTVLTGFAERWSQYAFILKIAL